MSKLYYPTASDFTVNACLGKRWGGFFKYQSCCNVVMVTNLS